MSKRLSGLVGCAFLGWAGFAQALGLGEIESRSRLNQQVSATIPILSATGIELDSLTVELAGNDEFDRAGMERPEFLSTLKFTVENDTIRVTSKGIAREPFVSFLLDVKWSGGRLLREYTLLLDPPLLARGTGITQPGAAPAQMPAPAPEASAPPPDQPPPPETGMAAGEPPAEGAPAEAAQAAPPPDQPAPEGPVASAEASAEGGNYGPVSPKETLWSIAYKLRPDPATITMDQMQVAIFNANPKAFRGGSIRGLMKGSMLRIPSADEIRAVDTASAKRLVAEAREGGMVASAPPPPVERPPAPVEQAPPPVEAAPPPPAPEPAPSTAEATPPPPTPEAAPPSEAAPAGAPPPSEVAAAPPPPPAEAPSAEKPAEPAETTPAPAARPAPAAKDEGGFAEILSSVLENGKALLENQMAQYIAGGIVGLIVLLLLGRSVMNKIAQARYNRASKQVEAARSGGAPSVGNEDVTQVAESPTPSMQAALDAADSPTVVTGAPLASTQAMGADTMQQTMQQTQVQEPPLAGTGGRAVDFDVTSNFASETVQINLDAGDPLSEAEFHRAYGLYDEAALMLKQALQKDPNRTDAKVKLAEIYFEAGKANEFVEVAKELKGQLPADKWQPIALLGSQIAASNPLFAGAAAGGGGTVDLSFDEPMAAAPAAATAAAPAGDSLEFDLGSLSLDTGAAAAPAAAPAAPAAAAGESLEFDLGGFTEAPAAAPAAAEPAAAPAASADMGLDLGSFDIGAGAEPAAAPAAGGEVVELSTAAMDEASAPADETGTKLDLARAYLDMGDSDMAKSLLNEVSQQGNDAQKKEAEELLKRASA
jgi:pilus assembly protein FimV